MLPVHAGIFGIFCQHGVHVAREDRCNRTLKEFTQTSHQVTRSSAASVDVCSRTAAKLACREWCIFHNLYKTNQVKEVTVYQILQGPYECIPPSCLRRPPHQHLGNENPVRQNHKAPEQIYKADIPVRTFEKCGTGLKFYIK